MGLLLPYTPSTCQLDLLNCMVRDLTGKCNPCLVSAGDRCKLPAGAGSHEMEQCTQLQRHFKSACSFHISGHAGSDVIKLHLDHQIWEATELSGGRPESPTAPSSEPRTGTERVHLELQMKNPLTPKAFGGEGQGECWTLHANWSV